MAPGAIDTTSKEYKKARLNHFKSTRNRPPAESFDWSPFRAAEKRFKAKFPPPDLSDVLDLARLDESRAAEIDCGSWGPTLSFEDAKGVKEIRLNVDELGAGLGSKCRAFTVAEVPGLIILHGYLSNQIQRELIRWSLVEHARQPNETNLDAHYVVPAEGIWNLHVESKRRISEGAEEAIEIQPRCTASLDSAHAHTSGPRQLIENTPAEPSNFADISKSPKPPPEPSQSVRPVSASELLPKLRWTNIGWSYHWGSKQYDFSKPRVPVAGLVGRMCKEIVKSIEWSDVFSSEVDEDAAAWEAAQDDWRSWSDSYEPDAGIVNYYQLKDALMAHVDRSEVCATSPLVSISLGHAAVFLIGGSTRDVPPIPILLRSGDAVVMAGPRCRRVYHGIPRILERTLPEHLCGSSGDDHDWTLFENFLHTTRINVNVRQVFPKGFAPFKAKH